MRSLFILLVVLAPLAGCKRDRGGGSRTSTGSARGSATATGSATGSASTTAPSGPVDLLHTIDVRMAISSIVDNPKISAYDLVDGDMATAWNSKTGELKGAWIAFRIPPSTHVDHVELTVGFVSKGPEGDYFTENPRIKKVALWHDGIRLREVELDIKSRELQKIPVDANGGDYKLEVTAFEPGSKKNWREICVSELRVIGMPAPGAKTGDYSPSISLASLDAEPLPEPRLDLDVPDSYASVAEFCAKFMTRPPASCAPWDSHCEQTPEPSACGDKPDEPLPLPSLPADWKASWFVSYLGNSKVKACNLALEANGRVYILERLGGAGSIGSVPCGQSIDMQSDLAKNEHSRSEVHVVDNRVLLVTTVPGEVDQMDGNKLPFSEELRICGVTKDGLPACAKAKLGQLDVKNMSGEDGYAQWLEAAWRDDYKLENGDLVISRKSGKPGDYDEDVKPGRYRLVLPE